MSTTPHELHTFMAQITEEMASEYGRIYARAAEDPGTAGDEGEENWAALLREWLPPNYHVRTKGRLLSHDGTTSPQIDVLILKPSYPRKLLEKKIWLADGVAAAFECKTTLKAVHVADSVKRCEAFKNLIKPRFGSPRRELRSSPIYGVLAHSHSWKGKKSKPEENVAQALHSAREKITHPRFELDVICVADLATWTFSYAPYYAASWFPSIQEELQKELGGDWGVITSMVCASPGTQRQELTFRPIAALLANVIQGLAWSDISMRDLADYYRLVNMWGSAEGPQRRWPASVYSTEVFNGLSEGKFTTGLDWDEWSLAGL
ncbi:DUF6602 domain-containing protein [Falsiroseomonas sp.]|uniref:DUF6602 domain-containing protein n=1 Tax=Falsiroseomonas sp. TaxID=2870721 RepID=UPI002736A0D5|nr:DUF6602 domain-containing protein [Falsiroseomonas sp.]MDP3417638.1 hypothetical protein [Falsiroseomonas sp.]